NDNNDNNDNNENNKYYLDFDPALVHKLINELNYDSYEKLKNYLMINCDDNENNSSNTQIDLEYIDTFNDNHWSLQFYFSDMDVAGNISLNEIIQYNSTRPQLQQIRIEETIYNIGCVYLSYNKNKIYINSYNLLSLFKKIWKKYNISEKEFLTHCG